MSRLHDKYKQEIVPALVKEFQGGALGNPCHARVYQVQP